MADSNNPNAITLQIDVRLYQPNRGSGSLSINESVELDCESFLEMSKVLAQFHDLAQSLKKGKEQKR